MNKLYLDKAFKPTPSFLTPCNLRKANKLLRPILSAFYSLDELAGSVPMPSLWVKASVALTPWAPFLSLRPGLWPAALTLPESTASCQQGATFGGVGPSSGSGGTR